MPFVSPPCSGSPDEQEQDLIDPIAVVGFSLRLPQDATSAASFWRMLEEKRCTMTDWPEDRLNIDAYHQPARHGQNKIIARGGHFLAEDPAIFDASFFSITATEAVAMDPQQRILLETAYRALENAGIPIERILGSKTGVYTGSMSDAYKMLLVRDVDDIPKYAATGGSINMLANRISWFFDLTGPSINLDSACSSSLMALDFACQGLRNRDSSMALVAGSNLVLGVEGSLSLSSMGFLSPDSRCYSFDERANGYSRGEGFGVVVLKRVSDAIADGDTIRAVIRSTGSNQDGHTPGVTQPSKDSQARLIRETYQKAGLDLGPTRYFEAHGTGTAIGDPIEADAIGSVFRGCRSTDDPLYIGALKSNIGHLEGGAGLAALIKAIMILEHGVIPPNTNFERLNPRIDADFLSLRFPTKLMPWPGQGLRRIAVNSFGFGGSNAHAVLDDAYNFLQLRGLSAHHSTVETPPIFSNGLSSTKYMNGSNVEEGITSFSTNENSNGTTNGMTNGINDHDNDTNVLRNEAVTTPPRLLVWSGSDENATIRMTASFADHFANHPPPDAAYIDDLAYTLVSRRSFFPWKSFALLHPHNSLQSLQKSISRPIRSSKDTGIAFVFTGQGAQYRRMGIDLLRFPVFERVLQSFDLALSKYGCNWSIADVLTADGDRFNIDFPEFSQPLSTALQIGLVELLRSFSIKPSSVVGHSSGEIAAAYTVGSLSLDSACRVAYFRGRLAGMLAHTEHSSGAMLAVNLSEAEVRSFIERSWLSDRSHRISVACINSPFNVTLSGDEDDIDYLKTLLDRELIFCRKVKTGVAYHSPQMQLVADDYLASLQGLKPGASQSPKITMVSSVTGDYISDLSLLSKPDYWVRNMIQPVKFSEALTRLMSQTGLKRKLGAPVRKAVHDIIEVGPHPALQRPIKQILEYIKRGDVRYNTVLSRFNPALDTTLELAGRLWSIGYPMDLECINGITPASRQSRKVLTDLPEYPFNRANKYWAESPTSANLRLRPVPAMTLLGPPVADWNPLEAQWRRSLSAGEMSWLAGHKVNGRIILPAAGMVFMALEAVAQIAMSRDKPVEGFYVKEALFSNPITISSDDDQKTDTALYLRPVQNSIQKESTWSDIRICVREHDRWNEACRATIQVRFKGTPSTINGNFDNEALLQRQYDNAAQTCARPVDAGQMYQHFSKMGLGYGPAFEGLQNLAWNGSDMAIAEIRQTVSEPSLNSDLLDNLLHPTIMDAIAQLMWVPLTEGATKLQPTGVPTKMCNLWLSTASPSLGDGEVLRTCSTSHFIGMRGAHGSVIVLDTQGGVKLSVEHIETTVVASQMSLTNDGPTRRLCYGMDWKLDVSIIEVDRLLDYMCPDYSGDVQHVGFYQNLGPVLMFFVNQALKHLSNYHIQSTEPHLRKYVEWMDLWNSKLENGTLPYFDPTGHSIPADEEDMRLRIQCLEEMNSRGKLYTTFGRNLIPIIQKEVQPRELLYSHGLADAYYEDLYGSFRCREKLYKYLDSLAHKNPAMKVLEVASDAGSMTQHILAPLLLHGENESGTPRFSQYAFTSTDSDVASRAQEKFANLKDRMTFSVFDIGRGPLEQGFAPDSHDLVIATGVSAHTDPNVALCNIRKTLKPNGHLVLLEITEPDIVRSGFMLGLFSSWWRDAQKDKAWSPCLSEQQWDQALRETGFSGADVVIRDHEDDLCHEYSFIITTAIPESQKPVAPLKTVVLIESESTTQSHLAHQIQCEICKHGSCDIVTLDQLSELKHLDNFWFIFLPDMHGTYLHNIEETQWTSLKQMLTLAKRLLWVTDCSKALDAQLESNLCFGLLRCLRSEDVSKLLVTLALEKPSEAVESSTKSIVKVLRASSHSLADEVELEYIEKDGMLLINRAVESNDVDANIRSQVHPQLSQRAFGHCPPLSLKIGSPGVLDSLQFVEDSKHLLPLGPNEIEIEVKALGLNFRDLFVALGRLDEEDLGCECSGVVARVGSNCTFIRPGDRVVAAVDGCIKTFARIDENIAVRMSDTMSFEEAASIPIVGMTAYWSLMEKARLQKGESVLIHAGSGATGQMAIQLALCIGAEVYATVGYEDKQQLLMDRYNIPEDHIFYSRNTAFREAILHMTQNKGVDVVLNSLSGDSLLASWECIAPYGRFVEIGKSDIKANSNLPMAAFEKNVSFFGVAIDHLGRTRPALAVKQLQAVVELLEQGTLSTPFPLHTYPISAMEEAFRFLQSGKSTGKIILTVSPNDQVPTYLMSKSTYRLAPDATYIIAGGLGGLGRSAAKWMANKGARNLLLLSRSGETSSAASSLLHGLRVQGVNVQAPRCDISSAETLRSVLVSCAKTMPPIRGCLQGTMVLQDALFENMTHSQWTTSIRSKVDTTRNLHDLLPQDLDFFIMLSSLSGIIGAVGQSNYAAGNTYQDALARHRVSQGQKAISLDLGIMASVGVVAENEQYQKQWGDETEMISVQETEFHALLDHYCNPELEVQSETKSQALIGLVTPNQLKAKGAEIPSFLSRPIFSVLSQIDATTSNSQHASTSQATDFGASFLRATSTADAAEVVLQGLVRKIAKSLSVDEKDVDTSKPLSAYGVDSLLAVELRNWFAKEFMADVAIFDIMGLGSMSEVGSVVAGKSRGRKREEV